MSSHHGSTSRAGGPSEPLDAGALVAACEEAVRTYEPAKTTVDSHATDYLASKRITDPDDARFIVAGMSIEYLKKARGTITGVCECPVVTTSERQEYQVPVSLRNASGEEVATATLLEGEGTWGVFNEIDPQNPPLLKYWFSAPTVTKPHDWFYVDGLSTNRLGVTLRAAACDSLELAWQPAVDNGFAVRGYSLSYRRRDAAAQRIQRAARRSLMRADLPVRSRK